jgi:hypothetical protein
MEETPKAAAEGGKVVQISQPRAYQLELFEASMRRNVIVTVRMILRGLSPTGLPNDILDGYRQREDTNVSQMQKRSTYPNLDTVS